MNIRGAAALMRLYEACTDEELRLWAVRMVPELADVCVKPKRPVKQRYHLLAYDKHRPAYPIGTKVVWACENDIAQHAQIYGSRFDLVKDIDVKWELLS